MIATEKLDIDNDNFEAALDFAKSIFGLHKSVTGDGVDDAFRRLQAVTGCDISEFKSGRQVLDWEIPLSWCCDGLDIKCSRTGQSLVTLDHPLRVASHSNAFQGTLAGAELKRRCRTSKPHPDSLVHQYMYYDSNWGISLTQDEFDKIDDTSTYDIQLDCRHYPGSLKVGESVINGRDSREIAFLSHMCHPAQFNDGLTGVLVNVYLLSWIRQTFPDPKYTYKFLFFPETIGSHAYCSVENNYSDIVMAVFTEMLALASPLHVQMSENEDDYVNIALRAAANGKYNDARFSEFLSVIRNDEKVFGAPGIDVPSASVTRALGREFEGHPYSWYHTSLDTIDNSDLSALKRAIEYLQRFVYVLETDKEVVRTFTGIPMLSRRGLFFSPDKNREKYNLQEKFGWQVRNPNFLSNIAVELGVDYLELVQLADAWQESGLIIENGR